MVEEHTQVPTHLARRGIISKISVYPFLLCALFCMTTVCEGFMLLRVLFLYVQERRLSV